MELTEVQLRRLLEIAFALPLSNPPTKVQSALFFEWYAQVAADPIKYLEEGDALIQILGLENPWEPS